MNKFDIQRPYLASYMIFYNDKGEIALLLRTGDRWMSGHYGLPAGKVEIDESFTACAIRESKEEVGVTVRPEDLEHLVTEHRYEADPAGNNWVDIFFEVKKWEGELVNAEPEAHSELAWFSLENLPENMVPNVRAVLEGLRTGARFMEFNWEQAT